MPTVTRVILHDSISDKDVVVPYLSQENATLDFSCRVFVSYGFKSRVKAYVLDSSEEEKNTEYKPLLEIVDEKPILANLAAKIYEEADRYFISVYQILNRLLPFPRREVDYREKYYIPAVLLPRDKINKREYDLYVEIKRQGRVRASSLKPNKSLKVLLEKKYISEAYFDEKPLSYLPYCPEEKTSDSQLAEKVLADRSINALIETDNTFREDMLIVEMTKKVLSDPSSSVLILTPYLALSNPLVELLSQHFKDRVSCLSGHMSGRERIQTLKRIKSKHNQVVLGDKYAVFSPIDDLAFIAVTDSESSGYKDEKIFIDYRNVALSYGCKTVLFSKSPSIYYKARQDRGYLDGYQYREKPNLAYKLLPRETESIFPRIILDKISECLENHRQVMIYHHQRGYAPFYVCKSCKKTVFCPNCRHPLTYYKDSCELKCSKCGYKVATDDYKCEWCSGQDFEAVGYGTKRLQEEIENLFPQARTSRLDFDSYVEKDDQMDLSAFALGDNDILIGNGRMSNNSLLPKVSLIIVMDIDWILNVVDYAIEEKYYDLLSSLSKSAAPQCHAYLITDCAENTTIATIAEQNYDNFYQMTMTKRKAMGAPPYYYLSVIRFAGQNENSVVGTAEKVAVYMAEHLKNTRTVIVGPYHPRFYQREHRYRSQLMIKYKNIADIHEVFAEFKRLNMPKDVKVEIDIDSEGELK